MKNLKKIVVLFSATLLFTSCNSDDAVLQIDNSQILGTWKLIELEENGTTVTTTQGTSITATLSAFGKDIDAELTFTENPNKFVSLGSYVSVITTEVLGQQITQEVPINNFLGSGDWEINGNSMSVSTNGEEDMAEIIELNESRLKLKYTTSEETTLQGTAIKIDITVFYTLTK